MDISNTRLYDVLTRYQVYVEGVKAYQAASFNQVLRRLEKGLRDQFSRLDYPSLDQMTKGALNDFIHELRVLQSKVYSQYVDELIAMLKSFMQTDVTVAKALFVGMQFEDSPDATERAAFKNAEYDAGQLADHFDDLAKDANSNAAGLLGVAAIAGTAAGNDRLWAWLMNAVLPANGLTLAAFINGFANSAAASVENLIRKGYANRETPQDVLKEIVGTKANNYRDGQLARINTQASAVVSTGIQQVSETVQSAVASSLYDKYLWVSVIDNRTTPICQSRNMQVYRYGEGPLPPAHINCRSNTVPLGDGEPPSDSWHSFMKKQPDAVQNDILGTSKAEALRNGEIMQKDMPRFDGAQPLSVDDFASKINIMLTK